MWRDHSLEYGSYSATEVTKFQKYIWQGDSPYIYFSKFLLPPQQNIRAIFEIMSSLDFKLYTPPAGTYFQSYGIFWDIFGKFVKHKIYFS